MCETMSSILNTAIPAQVAKNVDIQIQSKPCAVCLEPSAGFHFGAFTCEGCKKLRCHFNQRCQIDVKSRKDCSYCRLAKCMAVGMKQELIGSEEEKKKKSGRSPTASNPVMAQSSSSTHARNQPAAAATETVNSPFSSPSFFQSPKSIPQQYNQYNSPQDLSTRTMDAQREMSALQQQQSPLFNQSQQQQPQQTAYVTNPSSNLTQTTNPPYNTYQPMSSDNLSAAGHYTSSPTHHQTSPNHPVSTHMSSSTTKATNVTSDKNNNSITNLSYKKSSTRVDCSPSTSAHQPHQSHRPTETDENQQLSTRNYNIPPQTSSYYPNYLLGFNPPYIPLPMLNVVRQQETTSTRRLSPEHSDNNRNFTIERLSASLSSAHNQGVLSASEDPMNNSFTNLMNMGANITLRNSPSATASKIENISPASSPTQDDDHRYSRDSETSGHKKDRRYRFGELGFSNEDESEMRSPEMENLKRKDKDDFHYQVIMDEEEEDEDGSPKKRYDINLGYDEEPPYNAFTGSPVGSPRICNHLFCDRCTSGNCCNISIKKTEEKISDESTSTDKEVNVVDVDDKHPSSSSSSSATSSPTSSSSSSSRSRKREKEDQESSSDKESRSSAESERKMIAEENAPAKQQLLSILRGQPLTALDFENIDESQCVCRCPCGTHLKKNCELFKLLNQFKTINLSGWCETDVLKLMNVLQAAERIVIGELNDELTDPHNNSDLIANHLQQFGVAKFIEAFKYLPMFSKLCKEDQQRLLKPCCAELLLLRSTKHFEVLKEEWEVASFINSDRQVTLKFDPTKRKNSQVYLNLHENYLEFCEFLNREWREDDLFMTIMLVIVLYSSHYAIRDKEMSENMKYEKFQYEDILRRYLMSLRKDQGDASDEIYKIRDVRRRLTKLKDIFEVINVSRYTFTPAPAPAPAN